MGTFSTEHIDWPKTFAALNDDMIKDDAIKLDLATAKSKQWDVQTLLAAAKIVVRNLEEKEAKNLNLVSVVSRMRLHDHPIRIVRGTAVAKSRDPRYNTHDFANDATVLDGMQATIISTGNLRQLEGLNLRGFGLTVSLDKQLYVIVPNKCELEIGS